MRLVALPIAPILLALTCVGCGGPSRDPAAEPVPTVKGQQTPEADPVPAGDEFRVRFETSAGDFVVAVHPQWAPLGAARFRELVESGYYDGNRFFRVMPGFVVQWGLSGDPVLNRSWEEDNIPDDRIVESNTRGRMTFANAGANSRTTQVFVNLDDNTQLDAMGFPPFGEVVEGMEVFEKINDEYRERPDQGRITNEGNAYLNREFPNLDYIETATIVEPEEPAADEAKPDESENEEPANVEGDEVPESDDTNP